MILKLLCNCHSQLGCLCRLWRGLANYLSVESRFQDSANGLCCNYLNLCYKVFKLGLGAYAGKEKEWSLQPTYQGCLNHRSLKATCDVDSQVVKQPEPTSLKVSSALCTHHRELKARGSNHIKFRSIVSSSVNCNTHFLHAWMDCISSIYELSDQKASNMLPTIHHTKHLHITSKLGKCGIEPLLWSQVCKKLHMKKLHMNEESRFLEEQQ